LGLILAILWVSCASRPVKKGDSESSLKEMGVVDLKWEDLGPVYFDFDKYILSSESQKRLRIYAEWLKKNPQVRIEVEGHCDERGSGQYNLALGAKRAQSVINFLVGLGVPKKKISSVTYGELKPVAEGNTPEAWAKNRRVEFIRTEE